VTGLSLKLNSASEGTNVQLSVAADTSAVTQNMKNFVEAFNLVSDLIKRATGPAVEGDDIAGTLKADTSARGIFMALRAKVIKESSSASGTVTHFNSIGVSFDRNGVLQFDESKMADAMQSAPDDVIKALSNNRASPSTSALLDSGLAGDVAIAASNMLKSTGVVKAMTDGFEQKKQRVESKQLALDTYIERMQAQYEKQFASLNSILAEFKATSERLKSTFNQNSD
jgi:flagellar hook-associated protein 2